MQASGINKRLERTKKRKKFPMIKEMKKTRKRGYMDSFFLFLFPPEKDANVLLLLLWLRTGGR